MAHPEFREPSALERCAAIPAAQGRGKALDLPRSQALIEAIGVGDTSNPPVRRRSRLSPEHAAQWERDHPGECLMRATAASSAS